MKVLGGFLAAGLVLAGVAFGVGKATSSEAEPATTKAQAAQTADAVDAPALASTGALPSLRVPKPKPETASESTPGSTAPESGGTGGGSVGGPTGGGTGGGTTGGGDSGGGSGGTTNSDTPTGEF
jgi:hypothetical protein